MLCEPSLAKERARPCEFTFRGTKSAEDHSLKASPGIHDSAAGSSKHRDTKEPHEDDWRGRSPAHCASAWRPIPCLGAAVALRCAATRRHPGIRSEEHTSEL